MNKPGMLQRAFTTIGSKFAGLRGLLPNETQAGDREIGRRTTPESQVKYLYRLMYVDPDLRAAILQVRKMDTADGRVKRIHGRIARDVIKGGLILQQATENETLARMWQQFGRQLQLDRVEKLKSDARGLVMEGNLPLQWVLDAERRNVVGAVRMPSETIIPNVDQNGRFKDLQRAYVQYDLLHSREIATFPLWQLFVNRLDPDNFDDMGALGRPFLDASRETWAKLRMTEEDLVIRRRTRAPLRVAHFLEGATPEQLAAYRAEVERDQLEANVTDYYSNKKGSISPVQGDANFDQNKDIVHLLDTFFAGTPLPKGMMGYSGDLARDILEDLKRDYYDEIDVIQDTLSFGYEWGFRFHLLLNGINPDAEDFCVDFAERRTETPNQTADRALKMQALGFPQGMVWEEMGADPAYVRKRREWEAQHYDPYPETPEEPELRTGPARVKITPGNGRKGDSATSVTNT